MSQKTFYTVFNQCKEFLIKNSSLISFIFVLLGAVFYYTAGILESQNKHILRLEKSNKVYASLLDNQNVMLQKQQQVIENLQLVVSDKMSLTADMQALRWYLFGATIILFVGAGVYFYSNLNNSNSGPSSSSSDSGVKSQDNAQLIIDAAKEEFASISSSLKVQVADLADMSAKRGDQLEAVYNGLSDKVYNETRKALADSNILDETKVVDLISIKLGYKINGTLVGFQNSIIGEMQAFVAQMSEEVRLAAIENNRIYDDFIPECIASNLKIHELSNAFKSFEFKARNSEVIDRAAHDVMVVRSKLHESPVDVTALSELCTSVINSLS